MFKKCILLFLIGWLILIFLLSNQPSSTSKHTSSQFSITILSGMNICIGNILTSEEIHNISESLVFLVRKSAHIFLYFVLAILMFILLTSFSYKQGERIAIVFLSCFFYACTDEIHQLFIEGRSGELRDVFIDSIGILLGIFLCTFVFHKRKSNLQK